MNEHKEHNYSLSLSDLLMAEGFAEAFGSEDKEKVDEFLYACGVDTNIEYETEVIKHRNLQGKVVDCLRYVAAERLDDEWLASGNASLNAHILSSKDISVREDMRNMSKQMESVGVRGGDV